MCAVARRRNPLSAAAEKTTWEETVLDSPVVRELQTTIRKLRRALETRDARSGLLRMALEDALPKLAPMPVPPAPKRRGGKRDEEIAVLDFSDTQLGKRTATYSSAKGAERAMKFARKAVHIANIRRSHARIDECHLFVLGDMVEGDHIFSHQWAEIDSDLWEQAMVTVPRMLIGVIHHLLANFSKVTVTSVRGNHGANKGGDGKASSSPRTNWDSVAYQVARAALLGVDEYPRKELSSRLTWNDTDAWYHHAYTYDWGHLLMHGDQVPKTHAAVVRKLQGWIDSIPEPFDYLHYGHHHNYGLIQTNHRIALCNGTTECGNTFAQEKLAATGFPCQRLGFYNAKYGLIADHQVFLTDAGGRVPQKRRAS